MSRIIPNGNLKPAVAAAAIFLCSGLSIAFMFLATPHVMYVGRVWADAMAIVSPIVFLSAGVLVFFMPRFGYGLGAIAALAALPWFFLTETLGWSSAWAYLNGPNEFTGSLRPFAKLEILSVALIAASATCSALRLLPVRLGLRNTPLSSRTWPAIVIAVVVPTVWLLHSATPWMLPGIVDAVSPELTILHVEKRGLQFHETSVNTMRDGRFWISRCDRSLFRYRFENLSKDGIMPLAIRERANILAHSQMLSKLRTPPPVPLRSWNAEGWYVSLVGLPLFAFTSEYRTRPPFEIKDMLEQIERLSGTQRSSQVEDVCLGFCYDPVAALGFWYSNQRCHTPEDGTTKCL
jgi:hypothetical protein